MDLTLTRSLLAVAEHGVIGDAAEALGLSQPALSRRIQLLEDEVGAELLVRSGRGVVLTEMGRLCVREGRAMVERFDRMKADIARSVRLEAGTVRVGGGATAVSYILPQAIASFRATHPDVRFEVREVGSREVEQAVHNEEVEVGVVTLPVVTQDLDVEALVRDRIVLVAGAGHPLTQKNRVCISQLDGQSLVGFQAGSAIRQLIDGALRQSDVSMNVVMELRSIAAILRMVETTGSLAFVSELGAQGVRSVQTVNVQGLCVERQLALISKRGRPLSPAASSFVKRLREAVVCL